MNTLKDIYIIRNSVNEKIYIGQSVDAERRWRSHISNAKCGSRPSAIDEAMAKHGIENFHYEVIERVENYNEREKYWIKYYNSIAPNGYNIAQGGEMCHKEDSGIFNVRSKIRQSGIIEAIIFDLRNTDMLLREIALKYNVDMKYISAINRGEKYRLKEEDYPIRKRDNDVLDVETRYEIALAIKNTNKTLRDIGREFNINSAMISGINRGITYYNESFIYPLRKTEKRPDYVELVRAALVQSNLSLRKLAKELGLKYGVVQGINSGRYYHDDFIEYPIRKK